MSVAANRMAEWLCENGPFSFEKKGTYVTMYVGKSPTAEGRFARYSNRGLRRIFAVFLVGFDPKTSRIPEDYKKFIVHTWHSGWKVIVKAPRPAYIRPKSKRLETYLEEDKQRNVIIGRILLQHGLDVRNRMVEESAEEIAVLKEKMNRLEINVKTLKKPEVKKPRK